MGTWVQEPLKLQDGGGIFCKSNEKPCEGFNVGEGYDLISLLVISWLLAKDGLGRAGSSRKTLSGYCSCSGREMVVWTRGK